MNRYPLCGLDKFKAFVGLGSATTNDVVYQDLINRASRQIESYVKRQLRGRSYTEYYSGDGTSSELHLRQWPINSVTTLADDIDRDFGSTYTFASTDYVINKYEGRIELLYDSSLGSIFKKGTQNIKAVYNGGYDEFEVITGYNDALDFNEDGSTEIESTLDSGTYTGADLATEIDTQLTADGAGSYVVAFNPVTCKFTITKSAGTFELMWNGTNTATSCGDLIGFVTSAEDNGALTYTSDYSRPGVPQDLEQACISLANHYVLQTKVGGGGASRQGIASLSASNPALGSTTYLKDAMPKEVVEILKRYKRVNL